jgi:hypothetical protein
MSVGKWRNSIVLPCLCLVVGLAVWTAARSGQPAGRPQVVSARLAAVVAAGAESDLHRIWVHFAPRQLSAAEMATALAQAEADLAPRAARRRARMHPSGAALVDVRDLPLGPAGLRACVATGARLRQSSRWLNAASFLATGEQIIRLSRLEGVRRLDLVLGMERAAVPTPVGGIKPLAPTQPGTDKSAAIDYGASLGAMQQANVLAAHAMGLSGRGVLIGMLDSGFHLTHESLVGIPVLAAWDFVNQDSIVDFQSGDPVGAVSHGTMTLSTVAGYAPGHLVGPAYGASVVLAKTEDIAVEVPIEEDNWVAGLEWAEALGADIISSSLGYVDWYTYAELDGNTAVTTIAADLAAARGLIVVVSAGNDRQTTGHVMAPADAESVVTVGAVDAAGNTTSFSSPGPTADGRIKPDVAALGQGCTVADPVNDISYLGVSGTSFSCPLTSGVVALMLERVPALTPLQVLAALRSTASHSSTPDNDQGWGIVDAAAAVTWFGPVIDHTVIAQTSNETGPYPVQATIVDRLGVDPATMRLHYRVDGGVWQELALVATGQPDGYQADLPGQPVLSQVDYYLTAASVNGVATGLPYAGADEPFTFYVTATSPVADDRLPALTRLGSAVPNPFNPQTRISMVVAAAGPLELGVYNVRGQLVRTLLSGEVPAGPQSVRWDGRDTAGRAVASGTYLYRLTSASQVQQRKMQLVR